MILTPSPKQQFFGNNGRPLDGGLVFTYAAGTNNKIATYSDESGTLNTNPIVLDFRGEANIWLDPEQTYKFVLSPRGDTDPPTNPIWSVDDIEAPFGNSNITQQFIGERLWPRTQAEIAAGVTPVNYAYSAGPVIDLRRFGLKADGVTDDTAAINLADAVAAEMGGATLQFPAGTILYDGTISPSRYVNWRGLGWVTKLKAASSSALIAVANGNNQFIDLQFEGAVITPGSYVGTCVQIGISDFNGHNTFLRCYFRRFQTAIRLGAALWTKFDQCRIEFNRVGVDFNAISAAHNSNATSFLDCLIGFNEREGIATSNAPLFNRGLVIAGGSIEGNGEEDYTTYAQVHLDTVAQFSFDGVYMESLATNKPDCIKLSNCGYGEISNGWIFGSKNGIVDGSVTNSAIFVHGMLFTTTASRCIDLQSGTRNIAMANEYGSPGSANRVTGTGCFDLTDVPLTQLNSDTTFTPVPIGSTGAGTPTITIQNGYYSRIGNQVFIRGRVTITAKTGMTGNLQISGLPIASANQPNGVFLIEVLCSGITNTAGYTTLKGFIGPASSVLEIYEEGTNVVENPVPLSNVAASTTVRFSGVYTV
jgi:hypothetical protein